MAKLSISPLMKKLFTPFQLNLWKQVTHNMYTTGLLNITNLLNDQESNQRLNVFNNKSIFGAIYSMPVP